MSGPADEITVIRNRIAARAARDLPDGACVNLGIGLPTLVADHQPPDMHQGGREIIFHSENGLLGVGPAPLPGEIDPELINAGKQPVTLLPGAAIFHHNDAFMMMRGGHLDFALLGAFQVSEEGDLANWMTNDTTKLPAVGGAMDLAAGAKQVWVLMEHTTKQGEPRLVRQCSYPLTAPRVVRRIYTELAVIDIVPSVGLVVRELAEGVSFDDLQSRTGAKLRV